MSKSVLVVDDDASFCTLLRHLLESLGHRVTTASSAEQALEKSRPAPDLIVTDLMLPELDGWELLRRLKAEPETRGVPVIVCSTVSGKEAAAKARGLGAADFIQKPFSLPQFAERVKAALSHAP